jgi:hypothetical protein
MTNGVELATGWVRPVPTMTGVQGAVATQLAPAAGIAKIGSSLAEFL